MIAGTVEVGNERTVIEEQQVAWLDKQSEKANSQVKFKVGQNGGRFIFYAGEPQGAPILSQGPFIGDTKEDIARLYQEYRQGKMVHVRNLPQKQLLHHA